MLKFTAFEMGLDGEMGRENGCVGLAVVAREFDF